MDLLHLEHFLAVVDEGTFTRAAERMNRTQPAVSQSIRRLEEEVGSLWSFENVKPFVREQVGLAIVPDITVCQEPADGVLARVAVPEISMPRRTLMVYRDQGYVSDSASELIKIVRTFNWEEPVAPAART